MSAATAAAGEGGSPLRRVLKPAVLLWVALAVVLFALSFVTFEMRDPELNSVGIERASIVPDVWLPTFGFSGETLISVDANNDLRVLTFGLLDTAEGGREAIAEAPITLPLAWFALLWAIVEAVMAIAYAGREEKLVRPLVRAAGIFLVIWSFYGHEPFWDWFLQLFFPTSPDLLYNSNTLIELAAQHVRLVLVSSLITIPVGLGLGILVTRDNFREFLPLVDDIVNSGQTVPTLAILALLALAFGLGFWPAIVALFLYGLLPVVRNTTAGLEQVDPAMIDAAKGMGMTPTQILLQIELPSAASIIMAGIRTSVVINVGTATLAAYTGAGGLGNPIASGLNQSIRPWVLLGAISAALLAILLDYVLDRVEYVVTPKGLQIEG